MPSASPTSGALNKSGSYPSKPDCMRSVVKSGIPANPSCCICDGAIVEPELFNIAEGDAAEVAGSALAPLGSGVGGTCCIAGVDGVCSG